MAPGSRPRQRQILTPGIQHAPVPGLACRPLDQGEQPPLPAGVRHLHLAFGHGVHVCLGASLARLEAVTALRGLFTRFPDMALAVPPSELRPAESLITNGHRTVPVMLHGSVTA